MLSEVVKWWAWYHLIIPNHRAWAMKRPSYYCCYDIFAASHVAVIFFLIMHNLKRCFLFPLMVMESLSPKIISLVASFWRLLLGLMSYSLHQFLPVLPSGGHDLVPIHCQRKRGEETHRRTFTYCVNMTSEVKTVCSDAVLDLLSSEISIIYGWIKVYYA